MAGEPMTEEAVVVYLAGAGRSGSTLLESLIAEQLGGFSVGELAYLWRRGYLANEKCSCGRSFSDCPFWTEVLDEAFGGDAEFMTRTANDVDELVFDMGGSLRKAVFGGAPIPESDRLSDLRQTYSRLYLAIKKVSGGRLIIDSSKFSSYGTFLASSPNIDVRVLQVVRDSRAVAYSWRRPKLRPEAVGTHQQYMPVLKPRVAARTWVADNLSAARLRRNVADSALLRYEDFVAEPQTIAGTMREVGLTQAFATPGFSSGHSVSGNPSRMQSPGSATMKVDDEWRTAMRRRDVVLVTALTCPLLWAYGYTPMRGVRGA